MYPKLLLNRLKVMGNSTFIYTQTKGRGGSGIIENNKSRRGVEKSK